MNFLQMLLMILLKIFIPTDRDLSLENVITPINTSNFSFIDNPLTVQEVNEAIIKLKPKNSLDFEGISTNFLKNIAPIISKPLFFIFKLSFSTGSFQPNSKLQK